MPQAEMARAVGLSQGTWSRIERGASAFTIVQLEIAAHVLGTSSEDILLHARLIAEHLTSHGIRVETARELAAGRVRIGGPALASLASEALRVLSGNGSL
jgi:transcriptional regulator with XRE-family HTH domain